MSIWTRLRERLNTLGLSALVDFFAPAPAPERSDAFAMAVVALGAKMAKADGQVTREEVVAFREVFVIDDGDLEHVGRFFDLARRDVAGFDLYAERIARMFPGRADVLETLLDALFYVARADGALHEAEMAFLRIVADRFDLDETVFEQVHLRNRPGEPSPYALLGITEGADLATARAAWRQLARDHHPDRLRGAGVPAEAMRLAERRLAEINGAYEAVRRLAGARADV